MKTSILARSMVAVLALIATPLHAQDVSAEVVLRSSSRRPVRQVVVVERRSPRIIQVERVGHRHGKHRRHKGYRKVIVYYVDGRYYDRGDWRRHGVREVVVYERDGRYYREH